MTVSEAQKTTRLGKERVWFLSILYLTLLAWHDFFGMSILTIRIGIDRLLGLEGDMEMPDRIPYRHLRQLTFSEI
jgi:hypothetical protein